MDEQNNFLEIMTSIQALSQTIIKEWESRIRKEIVEAHSGSSLILLDHLPEFLMSLSEVFKGDGQIKNFSLGKAHGHQRATTTNYSLKSLLKEYSILRQVILEKLHPQNIYNLDVAKIFHEVMDNAVQSSVLEYVHVQSEEIQRSIEDLKNEKEIRETFVSALSHDLRTPLSAAKMSAQIILRKPETADLGKHLPRIISSIDRIDQMIQNLLDANMIKAGHALPLEFTECNLKKIIQECVSDLGAIHGDRFNIMMNEDVSGFWSHAGLRRMLENLMSNAVKYGEANGIITVSARPIENNVLIDVHNLGNPIPRSDQINLFTPYHRTRSAKCSGKKGWGIGLTLVKGLVKAHSGEVKVESDAQSGTTFEVRLPRDSRPRA